MFVWEKLQRPGRYLSHRKLENDIMNKRGSYFQLIAPNTSFTQFEPSFCRLGTPGLWWILRQCCTTNTKTKGEMKRRSCGTPVVPVLIVKPATATVRLTALIPVLCPHQVRRRSMRWVTEITLSIRCARSLNSASALWYLTYLTWCVSHYRHIFAKCSKLLISQRSLCTYLLKKHVFLGIFVSYTKSSQKPKMIFLLHSVYTELCKNLFSFPISFSKLSTGVALHILACPQRDIIYSSVCAESFNVSL